MAFVEIEFLLFLCSETPNITALKRQTMPYRIEISQKNNSNGDSIYKIIINGETFHAVINTTPTKFMDAMLYLSDQFYDIICTFWELITCISNENHEQSR